LHSGQTRISNNSFAIMTSIVPQQSVKRWERALGASPV
jgi:hypothetical protein